MLYWNIRGIGNPESRITLKTLCDSHKPNIIFIAEPMIPFENVPHLFLWNINVTKFCSNDRPLRIPNLWGLWGNDLERTKLSISRKLITFFHKISRK